MQREPVVGRLGVPAGQVADPVEPVCHGPHREMEVAGGGRRVAAVREPAGEGREQRRGDGAVYVDNGTPRRVVWSAHGSVFTVVSDDPSVADAALAALPAPASNAGTGARLRHGVERLASWINPFG